MASFGIPTISAKVLVNLDFFHHKKLPNWSKFQIFGQVFDRDFWTYFKTVWLSEFKPNFHKTLISYRKNVKCWCNWLLVWQGFAILYLIWFVHFFVGRLLSVVNDSSDQSASVEFDNFWAQFHQRVYAQLLHAQIPKAQKKTVKSGSILRFWDLRL